MNFPKHQTIQNYTVADTAAPLALFAKNGFYQVGNKIFNHKIMALQEASRTNQKVHWNFNDDVFAGIDWLTSSHTALPDLYRMRAQQLRNRYNYLILCWSGGGDSTTILDTFLDNDILLDELVIIWPWSQTQGRYSPSTDISNTNAVSEWDFAIKPRLDTLRRSHPKLKITYVDVMSTPNKSEYADDTVLMAEKHCYFTIQRCRDLDSVIRQRTEKYQNVATIMGVNPAEVVLLDDWLAAWFIDFATAPLSKSDITLQGWPRNIEFFYWTPDLPEIVREQSHVLLRHLNMQVNDRVLFAQYRMNKNLSLEMITQARPEPSRQLKKQLFYPSYPANTFQVDKPLMSHAHNEWYDWFLSNPEAEQYLAPWYSAIQTHQALIHPRFFRRHSNGMLDGYVPFFSKLYPVGRLTPLLE